MWAGIAHTLFVVCARLFIAEGFRLCKWYGALEAAKSVGHEWHR